MTATSSSATAKLLGGRYRVTREVAQGGEGTVFAAIDTWIADRPVVLKRVAAEAEERLKTEFLVLKSLRPPALVEAVDLGVFDGALHLVEAAIDGRPLGDWPRRRELQATFGIAAQVAHALAHLHVRGLVHMDPTPNNILVVDGPPARGVLIDLGLVRQVGTRGASGTPGYVAPEILALEPASTAADVYTIAAALAVCLGDRPVGWGKPDLSRVADPEARQLLAQCLSDAPGSRPTAMELARRCAAIAGIDFEELSRPLERTPLCGRRPELEAFEAWLRAGSGIWQVAGAAGSGRTSFLDACLDRARLKEAVVLSCSGQSRDPVSDLVTQIVAVARPGARLFESLGVELADLIVDARLPRGQGRPRTARERAQLLVLALDH